MQSRSTMALLTTMPARMMAPMNTTTLMLWRVNHRVSSTPTTKNRMLNMMMSGWMSDSNWDAMTR